jgi:O-6-methylguanine DNA methyltransferase
MKFSEGPPLCVTLEFESQRLKRVTLSFSEGFECRIVGDGNCEPFLAFLEGYGKKLPASLELSLEELSPFRQKVLKRLQKVPFGAKLTYGDLAAKIEQPKAARAIGMACHYNPFPLFIPCHRVIASGGRLGGFAYDLKMKELLLDFESKDQRVS